MNFSDSFAKAPPSHETIPRSRIHSLRGVFFYFFFRKKLKASHENKVQYYLLTLNLAVRGPPRTRRNIFFPFFLLFLFAFFFFFTLPTKFSSQPKFSDYHDTERHEDAKTIYHFATFNYFLTDRLYREASSSNDARKS